MAADARHHLQRAGHLADAIAKGVLTQAIAVERSDETTALSAALSTMKDQLVVSVRPSYHIVSRSRVGPASMPPAESRFHKRLETDDPKEVPLCLITRYA